MIFYPKNKKGFLDMTLLLVIVVITLGIALTTGFKSKTPRGTETFTPVEPSSAPEQKKNLQLETLKFKKVEIPKTFDCGPGTIPSREAVILWAMDPAPGSSVGPGGAIKLFYSDEWPLTLGKGNVSPMNSEKHIVKPNLSVGDLTAKDASGLPYFPALFLSDITSDSGNNSGDAERGGTPIPPDEVWGSWKALGGTDQGAGGFQSIGGSLPSGADPFPQESNVNFKESSYLHGVPHGNHYAEIIWNVDSLGLTSGHTYRAQFIIHDGDFEGDLAEGCTTINF